MLLTGDLGFSVFENFREQFPGQFINIGVAEQNMMSIAAGLALTGKIVYAYSIATFATLRPYEQIRNDIASHHAKVVVVGSGAGLSYNTAGLTHHALEDIALMRSIPGMTVLAPADPVEASWATRTARNVTGPVYLRIGKQKDRVIYSTKPELKLGVGSILKRGSNGVVIATGNIVSNTVEAVALLSKKNIDVTLVSMHTIKPVNHRFLHILLNGCTFVTTVEEHNAIGGLGSTIAEYATELALPIRLVRIGVPDRFVTKIGSHEFLRDTVGLTPQKIARTIANAYKMHHG